MKKRIILCAIQNNTLRQYVQKTEPWPINKLIPLNAAFLIVILVNQFSALLLLNRDLADEAHSQLSNVNIYAARLFDRLGEMCEKLERFADAATYYERALPANQYWMLFCFYL